MLLNRGNYFWQRRTVKEELAEKTTVRVTILPHYSGHYRVTVNVGAGEGGHLVTSGSKSRAGLKDVPGVFNCLTVSGEFTKALCVLGPMAAQGFRSVPA